MTWKSLNQQRPKLMTELIHFVRDVLGCHCPDDILQNISYEFPPYLRCRLKVKDRLLVDVVEIDSFCASMSRLPALMKGGRQMRDALGMQRFRLVLSSLEPAKTRNGAHLIWGTQVFDENMYLHVVERAQCEKYLPKDMT
jgi:hypothetical protein